MPWFEVLYAYSEQESKTKEITLDERVMLSVLLECLDFYTLLGITKKISK